MFVVVDDEGDALDIGGDDDDEEEEEEADDWCVGELWSLSAIWLEWPENGKYSMVCGASGISPPYCPMPADVDEKLTDVSWFW